MYAFIHIPKTGGSTLRHMLRVGYGAGHCDIRASQAARHDQTQMIQPGDLKRVRRAYPNLDGICGHRVTACHALDSAEPGLRYFTLLREPRARFLSHFSHWVRDRNRKGSRRDFLEFCSYPIHANLQSRLIGGTDDPADSIERMESLKIFVGLTEQFDTSVVLLRSWLGDDKLPPAYRSKNTGKRQSGLEIDASLESHINQQNAADIAVYQFARDVIFPRQIDIFEQANGSIRPAVETLREQKENWTDYGEPIWAKVKRNFIYKPMRNLHLA